MAVMVEVLFIFFGPGIYAPSPTSSPCNLRFLAVSAPDTVTAAPSVCLVRVSTSEVSKSSAVPTDGAR